jgi:hypothetical protein
MHRLPLTALNDRLRRALGLAPLALAATLACDGGAPQPSTDDDGGAFAPHADDELEAQLFDAQRAVANATAEAPPPPGPIAVDHMEIELDGDEWVPKHVARVTLRGAPPDTEVSLVGGRVGESTCFNGGWCFDLANPTIIAQGRSDLDGVVHLRFLVSQWVEFLGVTELAVQAVVHTPRARISHVARFPLGPSYTDEPAIGIFHPARADDAVLGGKMYRACVPMPDAGWCPAIADFDEWEAREVAAYALDRTLLPHQSIAACADDAPHPVDCCYIVEPFEMDGTSTQLPEGLCVDDAAWSSWGLGRPFAVADEHRAAPLRAAAGWSDGTSVVGPSDPAAAQAVLRGWEHVARAEHASVASFARLQLELLSLGAPAHLLTDCAAAMADEIEHARFGFAVVSALTGEAVSPGPLPIEGALAHSLDRRHVLRAAILEGCIHETLSAMHMQAVLPSVADPDLRRRLASVVDDELRHAELSWRLVAWMLRDDPSLIADAVEAFGTFELGEAPRPSAHDDVLARYGLLGEAAAHAVSEQVLQQVVRPNADALFASLPTVAEA